MNFQISPTPNIIFGTGSIKEAGHLAGEFGKKALVVTGRSGLDHDALENNLRNGGVDAQFYFVSGEPEVDAINAAVNANKSFAPDVVIGFGGGSALDSAKAIAAMLTNPGNVIEYLEVIGTGKQIRNLPVPMIAIPTTAGTGSEATKNAVIASREKHYKASLRSPTMMPKVAIIDPELTYSLPPAVTANTGMDALTQVIEPFVSRRANPLIDALCLEGIARISRSIVIAYQHGDQAPAREDMSFGSLIGGLALANAGLGAVHGFASAIGGMFSQAPHGAICARLLALVVEANIEALKQSEAISGSPALALGKYKKLAQVLCGDEQASLNDGVIWLKLLSEALCIPGFASYGMKKDDIPVLIKNAAESNSMKTNPVLLTNESLKEIIEKAL